MNDTASAAFIAELRTQIAILSERYALMGLPLLAVGNLEGALGAVLALGDGAAVALVWATSRGPRGCSCCPLTCASTSLRC
jgi:hypothetical protein